jgi:hypothetical protein
MWSLSPADQLGDENLNAHPPQSSFALKFHRYLIIIITVVVTLPYFL